MKHYLWLCVACALMSPARAAEWSPTLWFTADHQDNKDVNNENPRSAVYGEAKLRVTDNWGTTQHVGAEVRGFFSSQDINVPDSETGRLPASSTHSYLALRQFWWQLQPAGLTGYPGESLTVGRVRLQQGDPSWWDTDLESVSWQLQTTTTRAFVAVGQQLATFRSDKNSLDPAEKNTLQLLANVSQDWRPYHAIGLTSLFASQHGVADADAIAADPRGINGHWWWLGANADSGWFYGQRPVQQPWAYHLGVTSLLGSADVADSTGALQDTDIRAWSIDGGVRYDLWLPSRLGFGALFAYGSGGNSGNTSHDYLPTGLDSSLMHVLGNRQPLVRFNDVLRADPTNLQQTGLFISADPAEDLELGLMYSLFRRIDTDTPIYRDGTALTDVTSGSHDVGQGVDAVAAWYFHQVFSWRQEGRLRLRGAGFETGNAFASAHQWDQRYALDLMLAF